MRMFEILLLCSAAVLVAAIVVAYDGSRDAFHPLIFIGPMLLFLYAWMPYKLLTHDGLSRFFSPDQLMLVQTLNLLGLIGFVAGCLLGGLRHRRAPEAQPLPPAALQRLLIGAAVLGAIGITCWTITIVNVGGFTAAFSTSYAGGYDTSGYVRDGAMLLLVGLLLAVTSLSAGGPLLAGLLIAIVCGLPWAASALLMGRRGPTFSLVVVLLMGWFMQRRKRPPIVLMVIAGSMLGWFVLFLVTNRSQIYIGSEFDFKTDVSNEVEKPDTGNEYIYGSGTVLAAMRRDHYFWMRRYLAQVLIRPIPSALWPTKYEDFGVPELLYNAGTGEGFGDALGWQGAVGSAPGIIADFWLEAWWFAPLLMLLVGLGYAAAWKRGITRGGPWATQYVILAALSIYLVMQTGEAVIFRTLELSLPTWAVWRWALPTEPARARRRILPRRRSAPAGAVQPALATGTQGGAHA